MRTIFLDGQYLKANDQLIEAFTPGIIQARGVFETILGVDGFALDAELHLKRLHKGLKVLCIAAPEIDALVFNELLSRNSLSLGRVRLAVWKAGKEAHVMAVALPYKIPARKIYRVCLIKTDRPADSRWSDVKSLDYGLFANAYARARAQGYDEALLANRKGHIFEASRANVFWVKNNALYTTPLSSGCLNGITRQQVIRQARHLKIPIKEINLTYEVFRTADNVFLTNSLLGIKPVDPQLTRI